LLCIHPRQAWKKRWFILRSGRLTGDPDVLEYYKNDHAKKPIRVIDLNLCEQVGGGHRGHAHPRPSTRVSGGHLCVLGRMFKWSGVGVSTLPLHSGV